MAGYYEDQLATYQKKLQDMIAGKPGAVEANISKSRDYMAGLSDQYKSRNADLLTGVASKYGISPSTVQSGQAQMTAQAPQLNRNREATLAYQRMNDMNSYFNQMYSYAVDQYQAAGYTLQQSQSFATAWARQQTDQQFQTEMAQKGMDYKQEYSNISGEYDDILAGMKSDYENQLSSDQIQQALTRSLTGLVPYAAGTYYAGRTKTPKQTPAPGNAMTTSTAFIQP
jgi:hypothetical protein